MAYTTDDNVREEYRFLRFEENISGKTGNLTLSKNAYAIGLVEKNGTTLTVTTHYTFTKPRTITLVTPAVEGDEFRIEADILLPPSTITALITKVERIINGRMEKVYGSAVPWTTAPVEIQEIAKDLVGGYALRSAMMQGRTMGQGFGTPESIIADAMNQLESIEVGDIDLTSATRTGDTDASAGRTGTKVFDQLDDIVDDDYYTYYDQDSKSDRNELSPEDYQ